MLSINLIYNIYEYTKQNLDVKLMLKSSMNLLTDEPLNSV